VITASDDGTARTWEIPILTSSIPPGLADWAEAVAGRRIDGQNASHPVTLNELRRLRASAAQIPEGEEVGRWARWFFANNSTRTISPSSFLTMAQVVEQQIGQSTLESLRQAVRLLPNNGSAQVCLALATLTNTTTPDSRLVASLEWQSRRGLELSPNEPDAWWARVQFCARLGRVREALDAMERAISLNPTDARFWNSKGLLLEQTNRLEEALQAYGKSIELSGPWKDRKTLPASAYENRSKLNRKLNRRAEATEDHLRSLNLPQRAPGTPATLIDLSLFYNRGTDVTLSVDDAHHNFTQLRPGRQTLTGETEFDLRAVIALYGTDATDSGQGVGIPIGQKCRRLHILHVANGPKNQDGIEVGAYRLHYADGHQQQIPIIYGEHLRSHDPDWDPQVALATNTKAWVGNTPAKSRIRLFETAWESDRPEVAIVSLDFLSSRAGTFLFLFAITAEP
jgi:tetratricopeptide (TPR) repeat protein